jgi:hypothetical protein
MHRAPVCKVLYVKLLTHHRYLAFTDHKEVRYSRNGRPLVG